MSELNGRRPRRRHRHKPEGALERQAANEIARIVEWSHERKLAEAVKMRVMGRTYFEIAEKLGVERKDAARMVNRVMRDSVEIDDEAVAEQRQLELERLDKMWSVWFPRATREEEIGEDGKPIMASGPNMAAANLCLRLAKRRAELLGLDKEVKVAPNVTVNVGAERLQQIIAVAGDPDMALALEKVAAAYAHGEEALEGEFEEVPNGDDE